MVEVLFKDLLAANDAMLKSNMQWQNYDLNSTVIPVVDLVKEHALMVLSKSYGMFHVEQDIIDPLTADVFIYFPILLQQLSITRLIDAFGVVTDDTDTVTTVRTEVMNSEVDQNSELNAGTSVSDITSTDMQQKNTGTVKNENDTTNTQSGTTNIENTSGVQQTGGRSVNLSHDMPEQAILGTPTNNFPVDPQGTPILGASYVQTASESFSTANPITNNETSEQTINNTTTGNNDTTTTNDITVEDTGSVTKTLTNSGKDNSESKTISDSTNSINETITSVTTNKQYAYEIKAFLETADGLIAFKKWEDRFGWIVGIL